jgi:hypothetical protein
MPSRVISNPATFGQLGRTEEFILFPSTRHEPIFHSWLHQKRNNFSIHCYGRDEITNILEWETAFIQQQFSFCRADKLFKVAE